MVRWLRLLLIGILVSSSAGAAPMLTDRTGDQQFVVEGNPAPAPPGFEHLDLVGLDVSEDESDLLLTLDVSRDPRDTDVRGVQDTAYFVDFTVEDQDYQAFGTWESLQNDPPVFHANLRRYNPNSAEFEVIQGLNFTFHETEPRFTLQVPHSALRNRADQLATQGDAITGFRVSSDFLLHDFLVGAYPIEGSDFMPDDGVGTGSWALLFGPAASGTARLTTNQTYRVSNGEATTLFFPMQATNTADHGDDFEFSALRLPEAWRVSFPGGVLRLEAGESLAIPILVTIPFFHEHGVFTNFDLVMQSRSDPLSQASIQLGVLYTEVPQPSGHHPDVYVHHLNNGGRIFNTIADFPNSSADPDAPPARESSGSVWTSIWEYALVPTLEMGIDGDLNATGSALFTVQSKVPFDGQIGGEFTLSSAEGAPVVVLQIVPTAVTLAAGQQADVAAEVVALPASDYVPFVAGTRMDLEVRMTTMTPALHFVVSPAMVKASFHLPLFDYHDQVATTFTSLTGLEMRALGPQEVKVNPGETKVVQASVTNHGQSSGKFRATVTGDNAAWAEILGSSEFTLGAGETREIGVAVRAPADATTGSVADIFIHVESTRDAGVRSLVRFLVEVDAAVEQEDESALASDLDKADKKAAPGPSLGALLALVAAMAILVRRRR